MRWIGSGGTWLLIGVLVVSASLVSASPPIGAHPAARQEGSTGHDLVRDEIVRAPDGYAVYSPDGTRVLFNRRDDSGVYQLYVGAAGGGDQRCITCEGVPGAPGADRHKLQPRWHPSGEWIALAGERDSYDPPLLATPDIVEGMIQSGLWVDIYLARPDGSQWVQISDFGNDRADGFTGVAFSPDGTRAVWAQIVDGNVFENLFGRWELIIADVIEMPNGELNFKNPQNITPEGAAWVEPGNFAPDGRSLLITADVGLDDPQGMDQFVLDVDAGTLTNLTNSPGIWDEHGVFSPDGETIFFMSSAPFRANPFVHNLFFLRTEFMLMDADGSNVRQLTYYNQPGFPESNTDGRASVAANGEWHPDGLSISALNLFFPSYETWTIRFGVSAVDGLPGVGVGELGSDGGS